MNGKRIWTLALVFLLAFTSQSWARGEIQRYIQEYNSASGNGKKAALDKIAKLKSPAAAQFFQKVLTSTAQDAYPLREYAAEKLAGMRTPHAFLALFQSFTMANLPYYDKFKSAAFPHARKKVLMKLVRPVLPMKADKWAPGKAFFIELLAAKKVKKAGRYVRSLISRSPHKEVRRAAVYTTLDLEKKKATRYIANALRDKEEMVRVAAVQSLGELGGKTAFRALGVALRDKSSKVALEAVQALGRYRDPYVAKILMKGLRSKNKEVRLSALRFLRVVLGTEAKEYFIKATRDSDWQIRLVGTFYLKDFGSDDKFIDVYKARLKDEYPQVASAAVWGIYEFRDKKATSALIDGLPHLKGTPLRDALKALKLLTGKELGQDQGKWKDWWQGKKSGFVAKPEPAAKNVKPRYTGRNNGGGQARGSVMRKPEFFGSSIESYHVGFVIDFSGSMKNMMSYEKREGGRGTGIRGKGVKTIQARRVDVAKEELVRAVSALNRRAKFNIYLFGTSYQKWQPKAVYATDTNKESAINFVKNMRLLGATNIYDPLEDMLKDKDIDTIYLLSDGSPNQGKYSTPNDIRKGVKEVNDRRVIINTIGFGLQSFTADFMRDLAKENNGKFIEK